MNSVNSWHNNDERIIRKRIYYEMMQVNSFKIYELVCDSAMSSQQQLG